MTATGGGGGRWCTSKCIEWECDERPFSAIRSSRRSRTRAFQIQIYYVISDHRMLHTLSQGNTFTSYTATFILPNLAAALKAEDEGLVTFLEALLRLLPVVVTFDSSSNPEIWAEEPLNVEL